MKRVIRIVLSAYSLLTALALGAQGQGGYEDEEVNRLSDIFTQGEIHGHVRNFLMGTLNRGELKDYYADALGGTIHFTTKEYHGFELGVKGNFTYMAFSNGLNETDPITGEASKWERELFDIRDNENYTDLDRLEELYIQYKFRHGYLTYGKLQIQETPLLNESDGRMKPFAFKGIWFQLNRNRHSVGLSWLDRISPRSTVEWFNFNEGIGLVNNGFQPNGEPAAYRGETESRGIGIIQYQANLPSIDLRLNNYHLHNLLNTTLVEIDYKVYDWLVGLQYGIQFPDSFQRNLPYIQRYVQPDENGQVLSGQLMFAPEHWRIGVAATRSLDSGRFLFPRELGRDHFFTSIPRSRLEGFGATTVITLKGSYDFLLENFKLNLALTEVFSPNEEQYLFNKYDLDPYYQFNSGLHYEAHGFLEGLNFDLLYVYRHNRNSDDPNVLFNTYNFHQLNFITNFNF